MTTNGKHSFILLKSKGKYKLKKRNKRSHMITLRILKVEEEKKRNKLNNDPTYNPSDKHIFLNNIDVWRICCYNHIGVI